MDGPKLVNTLPLTEECRHYEDISEVPSDIQKYWYQRYSIWEHYDYDIRMTDDAWFGVTPQPVARKIAEDLDPGVATTVIDMFAGAGGNAIAFALSEKWEHVIAIEKDPSTLACAQHNAEVYGVREHITFVLGDCFEFLALLNPPTSSPSLSTTTTARATATLNLDADPGIDPRLYLDLSKTVLFASPPWGGVSYRDQDVFDLSTMQPYNLAQIHAACRPLKHVLYLPRTSDLRQIAKLAPTNPNGDGDGGSKEKIEVVQYCMDGASKALVAYIPPSPTTSSPSQSVSSQSSHSDSSGSDVDSDSDN
ncbi:hypothetical protein QBC46DRAFT_295085 [Diplogelasinospora grovesii]|uniref:Trimethylguanosine synthase n=1 Tax=Diplogelasinospora grovesii TaxID=303347 RepID=A0AAN6N1J0_9PEZI|nr:hypothetical protein QBC46DRAFT_295085 [Diplogelasinospora grovesii]